MALVEIGAQVTNVSVHAGGMLLGLKSIPIGSNDITDAVASSLGIRRSQALYPLALGSLLLSTGS